MQINRCNTHSLNRANSHLHVNFGMKIIDKAQWKALQRLAKNDDDSSKLLLISRVWADAVEEGMQNGGDFEKLLYSAGKTLNIDTLKKEQQKVVFGILKSVWQWGKNMPESVLQKFQPAKIEPKQTGFFAWLKQTLSNGKTILSEPIIRQKSESTIF